MKILIIGGTRFMGQPLSGFLISQGHDVTVFHRGQTPLSPHIDAAEILGDRNYLERESDQLRALRPEVVIDMMLLTEAQARQVTDVFTGFAGRLVVASSCDVYYQYDLLRGVETGKAANQPLHENSPLREKLYPYRSMASGEDDPMYHYDKIPAEKVVMNNEPLPATVLRLPMVHGPGDYRHRFYEYIKRMADSRPAIILDKDQADWKVTRGYGVNCAAAIALAATDERAAGKIYNVGEPEAFSERDWIGMLASRVGWSGRLVTRRQDELPDHLKNDLAWQHHLEIDSSRIRTELGYTEEIPRDQALEETIDWELRNPPEIDLAVAYAAEDDILGEFPA